MREAVGGFWSFCLVLGCEEREGDELGADLVGRALEAVSEGIDGGAGAVKGGELC